MLECVVNVSEGRQPDVLDRLAAACGPALLDLHTDADHHRAVFTVAAAEPAATEAAVRRLATAAATHLSLTDHAGVHPRFGVIDVVPFVALDPTRVGVAVAAAHAFGEWIDEELGVPVFFYDRADPAGRTLPTVRREAFTICPPDLGPPVPHPRHGATAVGARGPLVAINVDLDRDDLELARTVARAVRERDGGLIGVRALGLHLASRHCAQVSMNLVDLKATGIETACTAVREQIEANGARVARVELVGLVPRAALEACRPEFLEWSRLSASETIEARAALAASAAGDANPDAGPEPPV